MRAFIKAETLLEGKAPGFRSEAGLRTDSELLAAGWERRFTADSQRAEEVAELYGRLGYEVRVEPPRSEAIHEDCEECASVTSGEFKTIYTRRRNR